MDMKTWRHKILKSLGHSLVCVTITYFLTTCSSPTDPTKELNLQGNWQTDVLEGIKINVLEPDGEGILVGTEKGLYRWTTDGLVSLGLHNQEIRGIVRLKEKYLLASVKASHFSSGDTTLFRSRNDGNSWEPFLNNFGGNDGIYTWIDSGPVTSHALSDTIYIRGNMSIARSVDGGQSWEVVHGKWDAWGGFGALIKADPQHEGLIWAGGISALSQAYLWKSSDYGDNWVNLTDDLSDNVEAVARDAITHPEDPDKVLVGLGGAFAAANNVKKSTDGGESWRLVLEETGIHTFAKSIQKSDLIYASGRDASTKLFFAYTSDFGETWEKEIFEEGPSVVTTYDQAVMMIDGQEILFLGTDQGLFSFRFE